MASESPWSAPELIPDAPLDSSQPALALPGATLHVVWACNQVIYHSALAGGRWSAPVRVATGADPALAAGPDGRIHCVFSNQFAGNYEIYHAWYDGNAWSLPNNVSHTSGASSRPAVAAAQDGALHAVWADATPGYGVIYHGRLDRDFWESAPIPSATGGAPDLAFNADGSLNVVWHHRVTSTGRYDVLYSRWQADEWSIPETASDSRDVHSLYPRAVVSPQCGCHVLWQEEAGGIYAVFQADRLSHAWGHTAAVSGNNQDCRLSRVALGGKKLLQAVWAEGQALRHRARPAVSGSAWLAAETAVANAGTLADLDFGVSGDGTAHVVWASLDGAGRGRLYHAQRKPVLQSAVFIPQINV